MFIIAHVSTASYGTSSPKAAWTVKHGGKPNWEQTSETSLRRQLRPGLCFRLNLSLQRNFQKVTLASFHSALPV